MTNLEQTQPEVKQKIEALPLPVKNELGFYQIEASEIGKQLHEEIRGVVELQLKFKKGFENTPEQTQIRQEYEKALAEFAVHTGRALGVLPPWSDETLVKEASFQPHKETDTTDVLINPYGNVALSFQAPFGDRNGEFYVDFGMIKQGEKTALKVSSSVVIGKDGSITFKPDRHENDKWGSLEHLITLDSGRVVADIAAIPSKGVFTHSYREFGALSKHPNAVPYDMKINPWKPFTNEIMDGDRDSNSLGLDGVAGKRINYDKVLNHMRENGFNGKKEIENHRTEIAQFLE